MGNKYKALEINAKSWEDIELSYNDLIARNWPVQAIIPLIQHIKNTDFLRRKLFACTSLDKLIISIYNPIELTREAIHIKYHKDKKLWTFKYHPHPYQEVEHERDYPGELLVEKFLSYVDTLKWW